MTDPVLPPRLKVANAIIAAAQTLTDIFPDKDQVTFNRNNISSGADTWLIVTPGGFSGSRLDSGEKIIAWRYKCELAFRFAEYNSRTEDFIKACEAVRAALETPYALKDIRINPPVQVTGEDLTQDIPGLQPNWIVQPLTVTVNTFVTSIK